MVRFEPMNNELDFKDKRVFVSGGTRGIGLGIARAFADRGARVAVAARDEAAAERTAEELSIKSGSTCIGLSMDVAETGEVNMGFARVAAEFGGLDVLVNNAGIANSIAFSEMDEEAWDQVIDTNLKGVYTCCREGLKLMERGAAVVNIASISGSMVNVPQFQANYNISKAGVIMLTKSLAVEYAPRGIRVNSVSPGYTLTDMNKRPEVADLIAVWKERTPLQRLAEISEIAAPVLFLSCELSSFITGHDLVVDGGITVLC